jgi:hypothetical protein
MIVTVVLAICVVCPLLEIFEDWDHTLRTGQEIEYTFVLLALCVGVVYAFTRMIVTLSPSLSATRYISTLRSLKDSLYLVIFPTALSALSESPPLNLRI